MTRRAVRRKPLIALEMTAQAGDFGMYVHISLPRFGMLEAGQVPQLLNLIPGLIVIVALHACIAAVFMRPGVTIRAGEIVDGAEIGLEVALKAVNLAMLAVERRGMKAGLILAPELGRDMTVVAVQHDIMRAGVTPTARQTFRRQVLLLVALNA